MAGIVTTDLLLINRGGADYQATVGDLPPNASANPGVDPPDNPKEGDIWFNPENGQLYVWYVDPNSEQWVSVSKTGPKYTISASPTPPIIADENELWFNTSNAQLYFYYNDSNSEQWVSISKSGPPGRVETVLKPATPREGDLFYDKASSTLQIYLEIGGWTDIN